jgi:phage FluMu protein Com
MKLFGRDKVLDVEPICVILKFRCPECHRVVFFEVDEERDYD